MKKLLPLIGLTLLLGCGGSTSNTQADNPPMASPAHQALWPTGDENPDEVFADADRAFQAGDYWTAQQLFGTLFIIAPDYRGGIVNSALTETCTAIGDNCELVFGRLEFLRDAVYGVFGPARQWPPQQQADFDAILSGYDAGIVGDYPTAVNICAPLTRAPLPAFAAAADRCAAISDRVAREQFALQQAQAAINDWDENYPCMESNRHVLMDAYEAGDWEQFVDAYPEYQQCATVLQQIIDSEILLGHPGVDDWDYNLAWSNIGEMDLIVEDNQAVIDQTSQATITLDSDPDYNQLLAEWEQYHAQEEDLVGRISTMVVAREALPEGRDRDTLVQQIDMMQGQLDEVRDHMHDVMNDINDMRAHVGLPDRETP